MAAAAAMSQPLPLTSLGGVPCAGPASRTAPTPDAKRRQSLAVGVAAVAAAARHHQRADASTRCRIQRTRRQRSVVRLAASDGSKEAVKDLPSSDFSDPLAKALKGGPPLRITEGGGVEFDFAPITGSGSGVGSRVKWGVLKEQVTGVDQSPEAQQRRADLRAAAAKDLVNIDEEERGRRRTAGVAMTAFSVLLCAFLLWSGAPWTSRLAVFPVFALAFGFNLSADEGL